jgi:hypothetical protein
VGGWPDLRQGKWRLPRKFGPGRAGIARAIQVHMLFKFFSVAAVAVLFFAPALVRAEPHHADAYESLVAVPMQPNQAPNLVSGVSFLSQDEHRHHEHLPLQLDGALKKVKKARYQPKGLTRDASFDF